MGWAGVLLAIGGCFSEAGDVMESSGSASMGTTSSTGNGATSTASTASPTTIGTGATSLEPLTSLDSTTTVGETFATSAGTGTTAATDTGTTPTCELPPLIGPCEAVSAPAPFRCTAELTAGGQDVCGENHTAAATLSWTPTDTGSYLFSTLTSNTRDVQDTAIEVRQDIDGGGTIDLGCGTDASTSLTQVDNFGFVIATVSTTLPIEIRIGANAIADTELMIRFLEPADPVCCSGGRLEECMNAEPTLACCTCDFDPFCCLAWDQGCADQAVGVCAANCG